MLENQSQERQSSQNTLCDNGKYYPIYFSNFRLISSYDRGFTNDFDISLIHFEDLKGSNCEKLFSPNCSQMDFWMHGYFKISFDNTQMKSKLQKS